MTNQFLIKEKLFINTTKLSDILLQISGYE